MKRKIMFTMFLFRLPRRFSGKESASQCRRLVPGLERSPGEGNGNPL